MIYFIFDISLAFLLGSSRLVLIGDIWFVFGSFTFSKLPRLSCVSEPILKIRITIMKRTSHKKPLVKIKYQIEEAYCNLSIIHRQIPSLCLKMA